ncbi:hypothetical protein M9H77_12255 [Catharanthus roseus]|uniref:Uncharacterized protein n=1 Tax=Catharanthus roseus TaxID=4058 RepID=A0ACC0BH04_CATRO|nr:hypothetical protein M9H77_12255 [Catharanthus roseus]
MVQPKVKCMEPSIVVEAPRVKELSQAKIEEGLKIHVIEETSNEDPCYIMNGALFDIVHDECLGKFVESICFVSTFLDTFMENHNDFVSLNQLMPFGSGQVEFSCNEQKFTNVINSLNTLFEKTFRFQFYIRISRNSYFEKRMGVNLKLFKVNPWALENFNLRKEAFEQVKIQIFSNEGRMMYIGKAKKLKIQWHGCLHGNALKIKLEGFEDQGKASKLSFTCSISKDQSREQIGGEN